MAAAELAALRQGEPRGGMEGPAEAVPERVTERNPGTPLTKKICALINKKGRTEKLPALPKMVSL